MVFERLKVNLKKEMACGKRFHAGYFISHNEDKSMKKSISSLFILFLLLPRFIGANENVSFFQDSVFELDGRVLKFLSGSVWLLDHEILALPLSDGIVVFKGHDQMINEKDYNKRVKYLPKNGILYYEGNEVGVTLVQGVFFLNNGNLTTVVKAFGSGAVLQTRDGIMWSIPSYDQYDTGYWLPPYKVIIHSNDLYMTNLEKGKKIWVTKLK